MRLNQASSTDVPVPYAELHSGDLCVILANLSLAGMHLYGSAAWSKPSSLDEGRIVIALGADWMPMQVGYPTKHWFLDAVSGRVVYRYAVEPSDIRRIVSVHECIG